MIDERERYERAFGLFEMPEPAFERLVRRRDRKQRNRRIAAGVVALVLVAMVFGGWLGALTLDRSTPADEPTPTPVQEPTPDEDRSPDANVAGTVLWEGAWPQEERNLPLQADPERLAQRFLREVLGWDGARVYVSGTPEGSVYRIRVLRCGPEPNAIYPGEECAPTIDETRHQQVAVRLERPSGRLWVVTRITEGAPLFRPTPPTEAEIRALLERFLAARVAGTGAERYIRESPEGIEGFEEVLYATTRGVPYGRFEILDIWGPDWLDREYGATVRLIAEDGTSLEEIEYTITPEDVREGVLLRPSQGTSYGTWPFREVDPDAPAPRSLAASGFSYDLTGALPAGWEVEAETGGRSPFTFTVGTPAWAADAGVRVVADPLAAFATCGTSPRSGDELMELLAGRAGLEVDGPHPATVGGLGGVRLDLVATADVHLTTCERRDIAPLLADPDPPDGTQHYHPTIYGPGPSERMRVYLLDAGGGHTIAILVTAKPGFFDQVAARAAPIIESFAFGGA